MKVSLFQGILIAVFSVGALLGLFAFATYSGKGGAASEVGAVLIWGTLPKDQIDAALTEIAKEDRALQSVSYVEKPEATLATDVAAAIATGGGPDLILASQEQLYALSRFLTPIPTSSVSESSFTQTFIDEGKLFTAANAAGYYGLPILVDPLILYSNGDILASEGIAKPPATWDALIGLASKLTVLTPSKQITRGLIGLGTYDNVNNARGILSALFLQSGVALSGYSAAGGLVADLGQVADAGVPPGESVLTFYTQFADPAKLSYTWNASLQSSRKLFQSGDLALYLGYASEARYFMLANPNLNYAVSPLPQAKVGGLKTTYGLTYALMISRGAKNASGAYTTAATLTGPNQQAVLAQTTGLAPATRSALSKVPSNPVAATAYTSALYAKGWISPAPAQVDQIFSAMVASVVSGRSGVNDALGRAAGALSLLFQK